MGIPPTVINVCKRFENVGPAGKLANVLDFQGLEGGVGGKQ